MTEQTIEQAVKQGDQVEIEYVGKLEDGTVFDSTDGRGTFEFEAGSNRIIPGMSDAVMGMEVGQEKTVEIPPDQAYGPRNEELVIRIPRERIPQDAKVGDALSDGQQGGQVWYVAEVTPEEGVLDGNHPLAGKTLIFEVRLIGIK
ncbi:MAG TPA: peptidylprolyl isomerase [bacterium]|nr:peptidylprolyl isomerase [bacterium]